MFMKMLLPSPAAFHVFGNNEISKRICGACSQDHENLCLVAVADLLINSSYPANGSQKLIDIEDERKLRVFMEKRVRSLPNRPVTSRRDFAKTAHLKHERPGDLN
jgi:hypothetical protein